MKQKIIAALKTRYKNIGLGEKAFDGVAAFLEKTVTKEEDIEAAVAGDDVAALVRAIQGDQDSLRARNTELQRSLDELREAGSGKTDPKPGEGSEKDDAALKELKDALAKNAPIEEIKAKQEALMKAMEPVAQEMYAANQGAAGAQAGAGAPPPNQEPPKSDKKGGDDVVDADFEMK